ncbi:MAG: 5'-nucleotidase C-terminal domain-containing protein, partial [Candidatus Nanopelagicaceae bacterium]|nr:5'-nucleotidase C-terminal domain-containing protein [Candidatus Nanopelagicaceae bacterium]
PFGNVVAVSTITGANLWKALENGVSDHPAAGRFPQISGFRFTFDTSKAIGSRIQSVTKPDGTAIAADSTIYTVATNDFMLYGGDGYLNYFTPSAAKLADLLLTVFVDSIKSDAAAGKVTQVPALDGRIKKVG